MAVSKHICCPHIRAIVPLESGVIAQEGHGVFLAKCPVAHEQYCCLCNSVISIIAPNTNIKVYGDKRGRRTTYEKFAAIYNANEESRV